ncbi:phage tail protein [Sporomusa aerivorans]|uniref:phage tail protein n=1 Tax=Sporomusa aerivorans TaxID=204936 RepID=UPI00352BCA11
MAMNKWVGWGLTTLLSYFLNRSDNDTDSDPSELGAEAAELGTPVPVVMGRQIIKSPLTIYYGDFSAKAYTEAYGAWSEFNAWGIILTDILAWSLTPASGTVVTPHKHVAETTGTGSNSGGSVTITGTGNTGTEVPTKQVTATNSSKVSTSSEMSDPTKLKSKEHEGPKYLLYLAKWLLMWLINGHNLKTTIQKGFKYYLGYQVLVCVTGENIRLRGLYIGYDKNSDDDNSGPVWTGDASREDHLTTPYVISVDNDELFGGADEGGGFIGDVRIYLGGAEQPADSWMVEQMSADSVQEELRGLTPAYRPFVSAVVPTAYVGKQAQVPNMYFDMQWIPNRLGLGGIGDNDANPMECIYEMTVNNEWGLGKDPAVLNVDSMLACGKTLAEEGRGVSIKITSRTEVSTIIDNLCEHLDMVRYDDPQTGKLTFKLIRDDYDIDTLPVLDSSIVSEIKYTRTVWSNSKGEIVAKYSDSSSLYETSTVTDNDPAIIEANDGDRNSEDVDFTYFTTSTNAAWAANRELREKGYPLASVRLVCNRKASSLRQGDVFKLNWDPYGIEKLVMRVNDIDLGDFVTGEVTIDAIEDVFGVGKTTYSSGDSTSWTQPDNYPTGVQLFRFFEMPWEVLQSKDTYVYATAVLPDTKTAKWHIWRYRDLSWTKTTSMTKWTPAGQLVGSIAMDGSAEDTVGFEVIDINGDVLELAKRKAESGIALARNGSRILMINDELMGWGTLTQLANGNFKVSNIIRATYDTVPAAHAAGDTVYFLDWGYYSNVTTGGAVCAKGLTTTEKYNITTATATEEEEFSNTKIKSLTTVRRAERPIPPGRIRLTSHLSSAASRLTKAAGNMSLAWTNRNKNNSNGCVSQEDLVDYYSGQTVSVPIGLQTVIRAYLGSTLIHEEVLTQTEDEETAVVTTPTDFTYTWAERCQDSTDFSQDTILTITAKLDDLESYQYQNRTFEWKPPYIVAGCTTEEEAMTLLASIYSTNGVVVSLANATLNKTITFANMPLILLGTVYTETTTDTDTTTDSETDTEEDSEVFTDSDAETDEDSDTTSDSETEEGTESIPEGAILVQDGKWLVPNGTALAITGEGTYDTVTLESGYIVLTYFDATSPGSLYAYQFDGTKFNNIAVPSL